MKSGESEEGMRIALERIAREAKEHTGFLDLGRLGLKTLPEELFGLRHLQELNLGWGWRWSGRFRLAASDLAPNDLGFELAPLADLPKLRALSLSDTPLIDLSQLTSLTALQWLDCSGTKLVNLSLLSCLVALREVNCSVTKVADLSSLSGLAALQSLDCSGTLVADLSPLRGLPALQSLNCCRTKVIDLSPLSSLTTLQALDCSYTEVTDLSPLSSLTTLKELNFSSTKVVDVSPLFYLPALQWLNFSNTQVADLSPLCGLVVLQTLNCNRTEVIDLLPLSSITTLRDLHCSGTKITDLSPLSSLAALQSLVVHQTQIADLSPLSGLNALQMLICLETQVADLSPLSSLHSLQRLDCRKTQISDLSPLLGLPNLKRLDISDCKLELVPEGFWNKSSLQNLVLHEIQLPGIAEEILSQDTGDNCLHRLRAHLRDLESGSETLPDVKLMVLGNGRVGKTQICRRLRNKDYDESVPSTHGILISSASLKQTDSKELARLQAWDFGGQEIYHGTHALFLKTRAVFLVVWASETETPSPPTPLPQGEGSNSLRHEHGGMVFRNHPLGYWLAYIRHLAGPDSPVVVVQTRCDRPEDEARRLPVEDADLDGFPFFKFVHFSSLKNRGRAALDEALREAVDWLRERQGTALIGAGRLRVQRRLEELREADSKVPADERQYRTLSQEHFRQLCVESGGVSSPEHLLDYLHQTGLVFYRAGLFGERIVLDQGWALEAIYTVFHREKCYRELKRLRGRFTRSLLNVLVWQEHSADEQWLFLGMMQSCGVCFVHKKSDQDMEAEYIAPDLLPDRAEVVAELEERWDLAGASETAVYRYELHQPGLLRSLMAEIGQQAGINGLYWRDGVCVYERQTRSHALIEQVSLGEWRGEIHISTQGGRASELLGRLRRRMEEQNRRWGLAVESPVKDRDTISSSDGIPFIGDVAPVSDFGPEPLAGREIYLSYAWGDDSPDGKARADIVERFCAAAGRRGITVIRDCEQLGLSDSLSRFMQRIGEGKRVLVVLSDKYLKSPNCMYELSEIWRNSRQDKEEFKRRAGIYCLPCAKIFRLADRTRYARYWADEFREMKELLSPPYDPTLLGTQGFHEFNRMQFFANQVGDILDFFKDTLHPGSFEELERYELDGE